MKITKKLISAVASLFIGATFSLYADEAYDIIKKSSTLDVPESSQAVMMLRNIERNGTVQLEEMHQFGRKNNGLIDTVFDIRSPASVKDTRVLQMGKNAREDDRWIYMPKLRQVRRIPMSERYKQFVDCEFSYNDMAIRHVDEDKHTLLDKSVSVTVPGGRQYTCFKVKSVPYKKSQVEYSYRIQYIDHETYLPAKIEYFDKKDNNKLMKTYTTEDWIPLTGKTGKKYFMRMKARMVNNITGRQTTLDIENPVMDAGSSPSYFTQHFLQTGKAR
ncbi:MAG: outer membrane lipoprotein-sorting protein [Treponema sp.]|nr:outer membrane lipoprotein-sorting protein [Treponema sp.]